MHDGPHKLHWLVTARAQGGSGYGLRRGVFISPPSLFARTPAYVSKNYFFHQFTIFSFFCKYSMVASNSSALLTTWPLILERDGSFFLNRSSSRSTFIISAR